MREEVKVRREITFSGDAVRRQQAALCSMSSKWVGKERHCFVPRVIYFPISELPLDGTLIQACSTYDGWNPSCGYL